MQWNILEKYFVRITESKVESKSKVQCDSGMIIRKYIDWLIICSNKLAMINFIKIQNKQIKITKEK